LLRLLRPWRRGWRREKEIEEVIGMKKLLAAGLLGGIVALGFALVIHAEEKKTCGQSAGDAQACVRYCKVMCNATVEVTNTSDGVVVKMTAAEPEEVKKIQECWANRAACKAARSAATETAPATCRSRKKGGCCLPGT